MGRWDEVNVRPYDLEGNDSIRGDVVQRFAFTNSIALCVSLILGETISIALVQDNCLYVKFVC